MIFDNHPEYMFTQNGDISSSSTMAPRYHCFHMCTVYGTYIYNMYVHIYTRVEMKI